MCLPAGRCRCVFPTSPVAVIAALYRARSEVEQRLEEAFEQRAATSEILRVICQSHTDAQPVFDAIASAAMKLCRARAIDRLSGRRYIRGGAKAAFDFPVLIALVY